MTPPRSELNRLKRSKDGALEYSNVKRWALKPRGGGKLGKTKRYFSEE